MRYYGTTNNTPAHQAPPVWRAPEGLEDLTAAQVGGGRAWPGFETTRRAQLAARTASGRAAAHRHTQRPGPTKQATRRQGLAGLREDTPSQSSAHPAPLVWRTPGARPRCRWAAAGPGRASRRRAERSSRRGRRAGGPPPTGTHSGPAQQNKPRGGRAWPGFEIDHSEHSSRHGRRAGRAPHRRCGGHRGPGRGAGGRRQGLAGLRDRPLRAKLACGDLAGGAPPTGTNTQAQTLSHKRIGTTKPPGPTGGRAAHASGR